MSETTESDRVVFVDAAFGRSRRDEEPTMTTQSDTAERQIRLFEHARIRPMMGIDVLESSPHARIPYSLVDPFILVHEAVVATHPSRRTSIPSTRTVASTTCGT